MKTTFNPELMLKKIDLKGVVRIFDYLPGVMFFAKVLRGSIHHVKQRFCCAIWF
jgi:hypothetical protein